MPRRPRNRRDDRCTTCHLGIDRGNVEPATLARLGDEDENNRLTAKLQAAKGHPEIFADFRKATELMPGNAFDQAAQAIAKTRLDQLSHRNSCGGAGRGNDDQRCL